MKLSTTKVSVFCEKCNKPFVAEKKFRKRGKARFCSRSCAASHARIATFAERSAPNSTCANCSKRFYRKPSHRSRKAKKKFCSRGCKDAYQNTGRDLKTARKKLHLVKCNRCGYDKYPILQVHHKDRNRSNNAESNLEVLCPNCHAVEHFLNKDGLFHYLRHRTKGH